MLSNLLLVSSTSDHLWPSELIVLRLSLAATFATQSIRPAMTAIVPADSLLLALALGSTTLARRGLWYTPPKNS